MKKKHLLLVGIASSLAVVAMASVPSVSKRVFGDTDYKSGTWVHYAQKLPGTVAGTKNGVREYWVHCGQNEYQFSKPEGVTAQEGTVYDVSGFETNDARYIIPIEGEYRSAIIDNSTGWSYYEEVPELQGTSGWWYSGALPEVGTSKNMIWKNTTNSNLPWYYVDTLNVTKVVKDWNDWKATFYSNGGHTYAADEYVDGYYVIRGDLTANQNVNNEALAASVFDRGFKGTFDGRGHKFIVGAGLYNGGIFGLMNGATVKNTVFDTVTLSNSTAAILGSQANDSTFKNITINVKASTSTENNGYGRVLSRFTSDCLLEDVDINVASGVTLNNIFGGNTSDTNTFIDVTYKADALPAKWTSVDGGGSTNPSRGGITYIPASATKASNVTQDILVSDTNPSLTMAGVEGTVTGITVYTANDATYNLGTNLSALEIPQALVDTPEDHGDASVVVTTDSGSYYSRVKLVTHYITTNSDLALVRGFNLEKKVYGYFPMTNDVVCNYGDADPGIGKSKGTGWSTSANGFYGRFDGRGYTLKGNLFTAQYGLFGTMQGYSSVVNLNIYNDNFTGWGNVVFGIGCMGAGSTSYIHIANVDVNVKSSGSSTDRKGFLFGSGLNTIVMQHLSVTVRGEHAAGTSLSLFPANYLTKDTRFNNLTFTTVAADTVEIVAGKGATNPGATVTIL